MIDIAHQISAIGRQVASTDSTDGEIRTCHPAAAISGRGRPTSGTP